MKLFIFSTLCLVITIVCSLWWSWRSVGSRYMVLFLSQCCVVLGITLIGYISFGAFDKESAHLQAQQDSVVIAKQVEHFREHPELLVQQLEAKLKLDPNSARGWMLLGMMYDSLEDYQKSLQAYAKARTLEPNNATAILKYVEANALVHGGRWQLKDRDLLLKLVDTDHEKALSMNILAAMAFQEKQYLAALQYWQRCLSLVPDKEAQAPIQRAIAVVEEKLSIHHGPHLKIRVDITESMRARYSPNDIVFIYAKAVSGPPMPLAVQKCRLRDLPLVVTLTDNDAMLPQMRLSNFKQVVVYARVSIHGKAQPEEGDALGQRQILVDSSPDLVKISIKNQYRSHAQISI